MELKNDLPDIESQKSINSSQLSYTEEAEVGSLVKLATDKYSANNSQCICNETPAIKRISQPHSKDKDKSIDRPSSSPFENIVNTQLLMKLIRL